MNSNDNDDSDANLLKEPKDDKYEYDVFLSHNWGENEENHTRVRLLRDKLVARGAKVWFDETNFEGTDINREMVQGVGRSRVSFKK